MGIQVMQKPLIGPSDLGHMLEERKEPTIIIASVYFTAVRYLQERRIISGVNMAHDMSE